MLPVAPGEKILQRCVCFRWNSAALKGAEVRGHGACGTIRAAAGPSDGDENMCRNITINHSNDGSGSVALLVFVMLQTQFDPSIVLCGSSHFHARDHAFVCGPPPNYCCYFYTCLTFLPFFFPFLCLIRMSSPPRTPSFLLIFSHSLFSLLLPSGDAAKRKAWKLNRVASLRSIYANSLHNSEGKIKVEVADL